MEVVAGVAGVWGSDRVGVRLSPMGRANDISDEDPVATFGYVAEQLSDRRLAYLHLVNPLLATMQDGTEPDLRPIELLRTIRERYRGALMIAGGFDQDTAEDWIEQGRADLIAFGRKFIANPDLPERFRQRQPLNSDDPTTYYGGGEKGYTDYPSMAHERGEQPKPCVDVRWR
jgi:N-ethylmaleimide reductase